MNRNLSVGKLGVAFALGAAAAAGFFAIVCFNRACGTGPDRAYWVERAEYDQAVEAAAKKDAQAAADLAEVKETAARIIAAKDRELAEILESSLKPAPDEAAKDARIAELEAKVAEHEAQGDLAEALAASKAENSAWAEKFSLAERRHQDSLSALNNAWQVKFDAQVESSSAEISDLKDKLDREHGLRLTSDALRIGLEKRLYGGKLWKYVAIGEPIVFGLIAIIAK